MVKRAHKPPRHDKAQHQGREELLTLLNCFKGFHVARKEDEGRDDVFINHKGVTFVVVSR